MIRLKKIFYFILGWLCVPVILSFSTLLIWNFERGISFWSLVYLVAYILFPILYKNNISQWFPNKFVFYGILYLILSVVFFMIFFTV